MASLEAPKRYTVLDAVNLMLREIGEDPVTALGSSAKPTAKKAEAMLAEKNIEIQSEGHNFNTERELELEADASGHIYLPDNLLSLHPVGRSAYMEVSEDGNRLYDSRESTFVFTESVLVEAVLAKPFNTLAQPARHYITLAAAIKFANSENPGGSSQSITARDLEDAKRKFQTYDGRLRKGGLRRINPFIRRMRGNR